MKQNVIRPNAHFQCDYFVHFHVKDFDEVPSHPGRSDFVYSNDVYQLEHSVAKIAKEHFDGTLGPKMLVTHTPVVRFINSTNDNCFKRHKLLLLKTHLLKDEGGHWLYFPETIRSWDGLELAWGLMESTQQELNVRYGRVAVLRSDVAYANPINFYEGMKTNWFGRQSLVVLEVPSNHLRNGTENSRMKSSLNNREKMKSCKFMLMHSSKSSKSCLFLTIFFIAIF